MNEQLVVKYIRTKSKIRKIVTYRENNELKKYHKVVAGYLRKNTIDSIFAKAYIPKASIYKNAEAHMYNDIFLKMDIENFFPSLNHKYMSERLYHEISRMSEISRRECYEVVRRCSVNKKGIPLGLITSPALANIYMKEFDGILYGKLKKIGIDNPIYTRYADDMVISFKHTQNCEEKIEVIKTEIFDLLKRIHLHINERKTKVVDLMRSNHVRVTGISITKGIDNYRRISVGKKLKNEIFWNAISLYDKEEAKDKYKLAYLKGIFSYVLSIEKEGIDGCFSQGMHELLAKRGFDNIKQLIDAL